MIPFGGFCELRQGQGLTRSLNFDEARSGRVNLLRREG